MKLHSRKKRVIDESPAGGSPVHLSMARYVVNILRNGVSHCAGAILAADIIITIPFCVETHDNVTYTILSNSRLRNGGTPHHISIKSANVDLGFGNSLNVYTFFITIIIMIKAILPIFV